MNMDTTPAPGCLVCSEGEACGYCLADRMNDQRQEERKKLLDKIRTSVVKVRITYHDPDRGGLRSSELLYLDELASLLAPKLHEGPCGCSCHEDPE